MVSRSYVRNVSAAALAAFAIGYSLHNYEDNFSSFHSSSYLSSSQIPSSNLPSSQLEKTESLEHLPSLSTVEHMPLDSISYVLKQIDEQGLLVKPKYKLSCTGQYSLAERLKGFKDSIDKRLIAIDSAIESYEPQFLQDFNDKLREISGMKPSEEKSQSEAASPDCSLQEDDEDDKEGLRCYHKTMKKIADVGDHIPSSPGSEGTFTYIVGKMRDMIDYDVLRHAKKAQAEDSTSRIDKCLLYIGNAWAKHVLGKSSEDAEKKIKELEDKVGSYYSEKP